MFNSLCCGKHGRCVFLQLILKFPLQFQTGRLNLCRVVNLWLNVPVEQAFDLPLSMALMPFHCAIAAQSLTHEISQVIN